jgi:hypothetical protein
LAPTSKTRRITATSSAEIVRGAMLGTGDF